MMHPRNRLLQAFVDRELPADLDSRVKRHATGCDRCTARVARMRDLTAALHVAVRDLDAVEPAAWTSEPWSPPALNELPARPSAQVLDITPRLPGGAGRQEPARREGYRFPLRWAALFLFATGTAGAAALFVRYAGEPVANFATPPVQVEPSAAPAAAQGGGGVSVQPADGAVAVEVTNAGDGSLLFVELVDETAVTVQVAGNLTPRFRARDGAVEVLLDDVRADVRVHVPASIRDAVIRVGDRVVARVRAGVVSPAAASAGIPLR